MNYKNELLQRCQNLVEERQKNILNTINELQTALQSETKSTAGDKHETGRAMLHIEREKAGIQLAEIQKTLAVLSRIDSNKESNTIALGSVVFTSSANYFISVSLGELSINNENFYAISSSTPIGKLILGKTVGDLVHFNNQSFTITKVL